MASRYQNQYMQRGGAQQGMGLLDLFPALGQWVQGNRDALQAPYKERADQQAMNLLGSPGVEASQTTGPGGLTTGFDAQAGSGLMEDPNDFFTQMQYATGLMGTPGYESMGQSFQQQALGQLLGSGQRQQDQQNWLANQQRQREQAAATLQQSQANQALNQQRAQQDSYISNANILRDDASKAMAPYRAQLETYDNIQNIVRNRGSFEDLTTTDDTALIKAYAKMLLPNEAVMQDDVAAISSSDSIDSVFRGFASRIDAKIALTAPERKQLYQAMTELNQGGLEKYRQARQDFTQMAQSQGIRAADILRSEMDFDQTNYLDRKQPNAAVTDPELLRRIEEANQQQNPPGMMEQAWDYVTDPLVEGWGNMRR